ncbi:hypothetical protein KL86APRO_12033 [uncultured Alphaproteobacteria bacterium]|uniref:Bacteriophage tail tape measure N-terminal domain-containing protein n=1 Tax=uncultured Alphaproteobacteria bacterium TaxID=91750 RepID=A0A212K2C5_9PROT|nr:hypothetical protein KL86APRO_12033 [uncultured Alphaproteobacteria bacterium]
MANRDEIVSLIIRSVGTEDLARLMKVLEATGLSADQAKTAIDKLAVSQTQATRTVDRYSEATRYLEKANERAERVLSGMSAAEQRLAKDMQRTAAIRDAGGKNAQLANAVYAKQEKQMEALRAKVRTASNGHVDLAQSTKLSAFQMQQLSYQINDVVGGLITGQRPLQILAQQGPQISQVFGGWSTTLKGIFSPTGLMVAGVAASTLAFAGLIAKAVTLEKELRSLNAAGIAFGNRGLDAATLQRMSFNMSAGSSFTRSESVAALTQLQRSNALPSGVSAQIARIAPTMADASGGAASLTDSVKNLTDAFGKGYAGVQDLDRVYNFLTPQQRDHIRSLYNSRDAIGGWNEAMQLLLPQMQEAADKVKGPLNESLKDLSNNINEFTKALATSPYVQYLIDASAQLAKGGADLITGKSSGDAFVARGGLMYGLSGAATGGMAGAPLGPFGVAGGAIIGGVAGTFAGQSYSNWLLANGEAGKVPSAGGLIPWPETATGTPAALTGTGNGGTVEQKDASDLIATYRQQIAAASALTDAERERLEIIAAANKQYGAPNQAALWQAYVNGETGLRTAARMNPLNREALNDNRLLGYQEDLANAALQGPAARQAMQDYIDVRRKFEDQGLTASGSTYDMLLADKMRARELSNKDATYTGIASQQQELSLIQAKIGMVGKSTEAQNAELAVLQAKLEMERRYGSTVSEDAQKYIDNARAIADANAQLQQQQAIIGEIGAFGDQVFSRIGSTMTEMAMNGTSALEALRNIGGAVASELYQEFAKLAFINPIKNALGISGAAALPTLGTVASHLFGFADGGRITGPGGPRSDSILATVSNGEYVVNADATSRYLPLLEAINENRIRAFADGGMVSTVAAPKIASVAPGGGSTFNSTVNVSVNSSGGSAAQNSALADQVGAAVKRELQGFVIETMRDQQRPGGTLYGRLTA